ncbi:MAG: hypothetical protein QXP45_02920 [Thermoproteota archaeon]
MSILFPFQVNELTKVNSKYTKLKSSIEKESITPEKRQGEPVDTVHISSEAKRRLILQHTKSEIVERIRKGE